MIRARHLHWTLLLPFTIAACSDDGGDDASAVDSSEATTAADTDTDAGTDVETDTDAETDTVGETGADACTQLCAAVASCDLGEALGLDDCEAQCPAASDAEAECIAAALADCDDAAAQSCVEPPAPGDDEHPGLPDYSSVDDGVGFVSLVDLGCDAIGCAEVFDQDDLLPGAWTDLPELDPDADLYVALIPGASGPGALFFNDPMLDDLLLAGQDIALDLEGAYTIVGFATDGESCATTEIELEDVPNGQPGGICSQLAIAHSLVYELTVVEHDWDGIIDGANWDPDFLRAITAASGDEDGSRGLTDSQISTAHMADWNQKWKVERSLDPETMPSGNDCDMLEEWCTQLKSYVDDEDDDCILALERANPSRGHAVKVNTVSWDEQNCKCVVTAVNTGKQDGPAHDYANVPTNPGENTWEFHTGGVINVTTGESKNFFDRRYDTAISYCFDEELRFEWPWETLENVPGSALE